MSHSVHVHDNNNRDSRCGPRLIGPAYNTSIVSLVPLALRFVQAPTHRLLVPGLQKGFRVKPEPQNACWRAPIAYALLSSS